jgi:hypothetical protein
MNEYLTKQVTEWITSTIVALLAGSGCLMGCKGTGPQTWEDTQKFIEQVEEFAEQSGAAATVTVSFGPRVGLFEDASIGFDTGVKVQASLLLNAACAREPG